MQPKERDDTAEDFSQRSITISAVLVYEELWVLQDKKGYES